MEFLPIGSVVTIKDHREKRMVTGYLRVGAAGNIRKYASVPYPLGLGDMPIVLFDEEAIEQVVFNGYQYEKYPEFQQGMTKAMTDAERRAAAGEFAPKMHESNELD